MRILFYGLNFFPEPVGVGKFTGEMVRWLVARGHRVKILCAPPYYPDWRVGAGYSARRYRSETIHGATALRCPVWIPKDPSGGQRILHLCSFALSSFLPMLRQRRWHPDVIVVIAPPLLGAVAALLSARLTGARAWLHIQDFEVDAAFELGLIKSKMLRRLGFSMERALLHRFDRVSTISETMVQRALSKTAGKPGCACFPNWVDTAKIFPLDRPSAFRRALGIPRDCIVLLYAGSMGAKQGLELILEAARDLQDSPRYRFVMAGSGSTYDGLRRAAAPLHNMFWLPLQPDAELNELLNLADVHLLPQKAQAADLVMPSKLSGMLASGRPIIATAHPGTEVARVVEAAGLVVEPGCVDCIVAAIRRLGENALLRRKLGAAARAYATEMLEQDQVLVGFERALLATVAGEREPIRNPP